MSDVDFITIQGHRLEYRMFPGPADAPVLVLLHEGLGSISLWRDFPRKLAAASGYRLLVWSRYGYGRSEPLQEPRPLHYLHDEALHALPELLEKLEISRPLLVGHSDGATIALLYAAQQERPLEGAVAIAPHVFVEDVSIEGIRRAGEAFRGGGLAERLARHHRDAASTFAGWHDTWLDEAFRDWNIEHCLPRITAPLLLIQGDEDEYATLAQLDAIEAGVSGPCRRLVLPACGHSPHREREQDTLEAITAFTAEIQKLQKEGPGGRANRHL